MTETYLILNPLLLIDDLGFIALSSSVKEIGKAIEKVARTVIEWGIWNLVIYNISKMEAVVFLRARRQQLDKQLRETKIKFGNKKICFNKKATR